MNSLLIILGGAGLFILGRLYEAANRELNKAEHLIDDSGVSGLPVPPPLAIGICQCCREESSVAVDPDIGPVCYSCAHICDHVSRGLRQQAQTEGSL